MGVAQERAEDAMFYVWSVKKSRAEIVVHESLVNVWLSYWERFDAYWCDWMTRES